MPPIEIVFHASPPRHPTSRKVRLPAATARRDGWTPRFFTYPHTASTCHHLETDPTPSSSSSSSDPATPAKSSSRRKAKPRTLPSGACAANFTPLLQPIVVRCLPKARTSSASETRPTRLQPSSKAEPRVISPPGRKTKSGTNSSTSSTSKHFVIPYNPLTDLSNDRSSNPSPRELIKAQRVEVEKAKAKKDSAAIARAAIAAKRRKGKPRGGSQMRDGSASGVGTRENSPIKQSLSADTAQGKDGKEDDMLPLIIMEPASAESSPVPLTRVRLKRTRSTGLMNISTSMANALGTGAIAVGSPLKAVMKPEDDNYEDDNTAEREAKRSRLDASSSSTATSLDPTATSNGRQTVLLKADRPAAARRASSHSPRSAATPLPAVSDALAASASVPGPIALPLAAAKLGPRLTLRAASVNGRASSASGGSAGTTAMRRVVSAAGGLTSASGSGADKGDADEGGRGGGARRGSSAGPDAVARERSRRETMLPRALRDYEMRAGAAAAV